MTFLDILRLVSMVVWFSVGVMRVSSFVRIFRNNARYYDQLGAMISAIGFLISAFNARWFLPESAELHLGLYGFSIMIAMMLFVVLWRYEGAAK